MKHLITLFTLNLLFFTAIAQRVTVQGSVQNQQGKGIAYATVKLPQQNLSVYTDQQGQFQLNINTYQLKSVLFTISMVGKKGIDSNILVSQLGHQLNFKLLDLSLTLNEVEVNGVTKAEGQSNSSIIFDRQAIEQSQAFSLTDILNHLPGKVFSPLNLQNPQSINLRSAYDSTDPAGRNNALGTAIILDGMNISNNANMQSKNIGTFGLNGSVINDHKNNTGYDVTFGGLDLREIPVDNIESIEVIQGVAPAQYGDLTDGAILINRKAGKTDTHFSTRINAGSTNISLNKGFSLEDKKSFLNTNINYLISNNDPRDNTKKYSRLSAGLMWTRYFGKNFRSTLSADFSNKFDDAKQDPDDGSELMTYSKNRKFSFNQRNSLKINSSFLKSIQFNWSADLGSQETYSQWYLNNAPKPMANKDTTGIYEGYYISGNYLAVDQVVGKPRNISAQLNLLSEWNLGQQSHYLSYGASYNYSNNNGQGVLFNPDFPRFSNQGYKNERPYNFELVPSLQDFGFYVQDKFKLMLFKRAFNVQAGIRYDLQNGFGSLQPRINTNYEITDDLSLNLAYGMASKAPTMAYRYPGPTYFDIPLIDYFTGDARNSLLLVHTQKFSPDNSNLKPSRSSQVEAGIHYQHALFNLNVNAFYKKNTNGFGSAIKYHYLTIPDYDMVPNPGAKPGYIANGNFKFFSGLSNSVMDNNVRSGTKGIHLMLSFRKIQTLETQFSLSSSYVKSTAYNSNSVIVKADERFIIADRKAWFGLYTPDENEDSEWMTKFNSNTHFPKLGLVLSFYYDLILRRDKYVMNDKRLPYAYLDKYIQEYPIGNFDYNNPDYNHLTERTNVETQKKLPFAYGILSMSIAKELKRKIRFSLNAYNFLNVKKEHYDTLLKKKFSYIAPMSIGAEITFKF